MKIPGLPTGVELVRVGVASPTDYDITNDPSNDDPPIITRGARAGSSTQIIVKPARGYAFRPRRAFDIKTYQLQDTPFYDIVRVLSTPTDITRTVTFKVDSKEDEEAVHEALNHLKRLPGYVETA